MLQAVNFISYHVNKRTLIMEYFRQNNHLNILNY